MEYGIVPPKGTINGLAYWTAYWKVEVDGKVYGEYWPIDPPRKKDIPRILAGIKKLHQ